MLLFLNGKSDGEGGSRCGASVKKKITSRGVVKNCSKDGSVLPSVPSPHPCNSENPCIMEARVCSRKNIKLRDEDCWIDHISRLPDELLVIILSFLSLKEAAASSILSRRWRFLWTFISKLDFERSDLWTSFASKTDFDILHLATRSKREASIHENWEYVRWVDNVLGLRDKSAAIEELRISFSLNEAHQSRIDGWIGFALTRKVARLDLNLVNARFARLYTFPDKVLSGNESNLCGFKELRLIRLVCVTLSDGALEIIWRSCPILEEIFLSNCKRFSTVKIVNPLSALKRLTVIYCPNLESVEVRDSNLVYFMYRGQWPLKHFLLKNVPLLVEMNVGGCYPRELEELVMMLSSCQAQLEKLTVEKFSMLSITEADMICSSVKMNNLKQLVWRCAGFSWGHIQLEPVAILVCALPLLERLVIMAYVDIVKGRLDGFCNFRRRYTPRTYTYSHLKQVEYVGYHSIPNELSFLMHCLENAPALEEVIIHPPKETCLWNHFGQYSEQDIDTFRAFAEAQLTPIFPSTVTLKIL